MLVECRKCETLYDDEKYSCCPRCQQEFDFDIGLQNSRNNKLNRESK